MLNKKGQEIGKIIVTFPVLLAVFFVIGLFIALSLGARVLKEPELPSAGNIETAQNSFLLKIIEIEDKEDKIRKMMVFDVIVGEARWDIDRAKLGDALDKLANEEEPCLILKVNKNQEGDSGYMEALKFENGDAKHMDIGESTRYDLVQISSVFVKSSNFPEEKKLDISYYYGKCLEDKNE